MRSHAISQHPARDGKQPLVLTTRRLLSTQLGYQVLLLSACVEVTLISLRSPIYVIFSTVYFYNCSILLLVIVVNLLQQQSLLLLVPAL